MGISCTHASAIVRTLGAMLVAALVLAALLVPAGRAANVAVSLDVPSHTALTNGCRDRAAWDLGTVLPGSSATTTTGAQVCRMTFSSSNDTSMLRAYQSDATGTAMHGLTFTRVASLNSIKDIAIVGSTAYSASSWGGFRKSTDGGATWSTITISGVSNHLTGVAAASADSFWLSGSGGYIGRSIDGGATWIAQSSGVTNDLEGIEAVSATVAVAVGAGDRILRQDTTSSTTAWTIITPPMTGLNLTDVEFADGTGTGWIAAGNRIYKSTDAGLTWVVQYTAAGQINSISAVDATTLWAVGDNGLILHSTDGGANWSSQSSPINGKLDTVSARTADIAYVASWSGDLLRTTNGGATWTTIGPKYGPLLAVRVIDASTVLYGGDSDQVRMAPGAPIPDWSGATNTWSLGNGAFGACLQAVGGSAAAVWTVDAGNVAGKCEALDGDAWNPLPTAPTTIASVGTAGASGSVDLVFGVRPPLDAPPGSYQAPITFETVAPNA